MASTAKAWGRSCSAACLSSLAAGQGQGPVIWLHAVSVGEVNLLATLLPRLASRYPHARCVISTTTRTGYEVATKKYADHTIFYCPLDFSWAVNTALDRIQPDLLILAELELWPNLIRLAHRRGVRIAVVNGRLSEKSFRGYRRLRPLVSRMLQKIDLLATQTPEYAQRFLALGARPAAVEMTGSLKFDGAQADRTNPRTRQFAALAGFIHDDIIFLAGSTQAPEEELALAAYRELAAAHPNLRLVLVPRHPERFEEVAQLLAASGLAWQRRTQLAEHQHSTEPAARILLVDAVGELGAWWGTAEIAYVGGSMGTRGGQNMIEPAAYGAAVSFGPKTGNFRDVVRLLLDAQAAQVVADGTELTAFVRRCLEEEAFAADLGRRAALAVRQQQGAADRTADLLTRLRPTPAAAA